MDEFRLGYDALNQKDEVKVFPLVKGVKTELLDADNIEVTAQIPWAKYLHADFE